MPIFDFEEFPDGTLLNTAYPTLVKLIDSNTSTITISSGNLNYNWLSGASTLATYAYNTGNADHFIEATYANVRKGDFYTVVVRCANSARNFIGARITAANNLELVSLTNGIGTGLSSDPVTLTVGSVLRVETEGNYIRAYFNGVLIRTVTTATHNTNTRAGFNVRTAIALQVISQAKIGLTQATIDGVNEDSNEVYYSQNSTWELNGIIPTSATLAGVLCSDVSEEGFTVPALVDMAILPIPGNRNLIAIDEDDIESAPFEILVKIDEDGYLRNVSLSSDLNAENTGVIHNFSPPAKENDLILWPTELNFEGDPLPEDQQTEVDEHGDIIAFFVGTRQFWHISIDAGDPNIGVARSYNVTIGEDGELTVVRTPKGTYIDGQLMKGYLLRGQTL